jgi:hypothetical protein
MQYQFTKYGRGEPAAGMGTELPVVQRNAKLEHIFGVRIEHNDLEDLHN